MGKKFSFFKILYDQFGTFLVTEKVCSVKKRKEKHILKKVMASLLCSVPKVTIIHSQKLFTTLNF